MIRAALFAVTALLFALVLCACGQKGPLKLPGDAPKPTSATP
jgi:predicted small lipoprotein YifL